jgi:HEAT repeat protein
MEQEGKRTGVMGVVAKTFNMGGHALVKTYDFTVDAVLKTAGALKTSAPGAAGVLKTSVPAVADATKSIAVGIVGATKNITWSIAGKTRDLFTGGLFGKVFKPAESDELQDKIKDYEEKIKNLYFEIGKEGATAEQLESDRIKSLINDAKEFEKEIQRLRNRISEMEETQRKEKELKVEHRASEKRKTSRSDSQVATLVKAAIEKVLKHGEFDAESTKAVFTKIAYDLIDDEMEVRTLAAAELGKMGNKAAAAVLIEAVKFDNPYLTAEIINSLINIGDVQALSLCKEMSKNSNNRVRLNCLRGLYKMGGNEEITPYLKDALKDEHAEIRRSAATFLGWKDIVDAVPALVQTLHDKDESVRKAAVSALSNIRDRSSVLPLMSTLADDSMEIRQKALESLKIITGKEISFNVELSANELTESVNTLKEWWQNERMNSIGMRTEEVQIVSPGASETSDDAASADERDKDDESSRSEKVLKKMVKDDLLKLCRDRGIECDETFTKAELIRLLQ